MSERTNAISEPSDQFVNDLEQRLREGIRRRDRLDPTDRARGRTRRTGMRMLATAALMLSSLTIGAAGTFAVVHQDAAPHRELHLQMAAILLERAQARLERRRADLAEVLALAEQGMVDDAFAGKCRQQLARAESEVLRRELDMKETQLTGRAPVDDLAAPLVDGEDFVARRLEARHAVLAAERDRARGALGRLEQLVERGVVSERELVGARSELEEKELALARLEERITLRRAFIDDEITAAEVELRALQRDTASEHAIAQIRLEAARARLQRIAALQERGAVSRGEVREAETAVREAESDLALAQVQLQMLRARLEAFERED
jgi:multidrug resistance efflux pump